MIVAINKNPKTPIFEIADFDKVSDIFTVLPEVIVEVDINSFHFTSYANPFRDILALNIIILLQIIDTELYRVRGTSFVDVRHNWLDGAI